MAGAEPFFSVIIPTHGRPAFLQEAVASVLSQSFADSEVIVVDDGNDEPANVPADGRVRVLRHDVNRGAAAARNTAIRAARGRYICFLDDDDVYPPGRLATIAGELDVATGPPILLCWLGDFDHPDDPRLREGRSLEGNVRDTILDGPIPQLGTCTVARSAIVEFDEGYRASEDVEWWLRQAAVGPVRTIRAVLYLRRSHAGERLTTRLDLKLAARLELLEQHAAFFGSHPRAAAYHWRRAGGMALLLGQSGEARRAFVRSWRSQRDIRTLVHFARTLLPRRGRRVGAPPALTA